VRAVAAAAVSALVGAGACSGSTEPKPTPLLASSAASGAAFDAIRDAWRSSERVNPAVLREAIDSFLARFPGDGLAPMARVYLALLAMKQEDFATADRQLAATAGLPAGNAHDLWTVAAARRRRLRGEPEAAMELLRPLVGKTVDPVTRTAFDEELTLTALATHRDYEAISYMDAWLRASSEEEREQAARAVKFIVERLPKDVLVGALQAMRAQRASFGYSVEIERILADQLVRIATTSGDAELARLLLDPDAGAVVVAGDAGVELGELATSRRGLNVVDGRTIGLLLPTESPALRDESADVLRGVMWALGLPRGVRGGGTAGERDAAGGAAPSAAPSAAGSGAGGRVAAPGCAPFEEAPPMVDPSPAEALRLVTRDDAGSADRTEVALDELVGEGAAMIVAALDEQTAQRALRWAGNHSVPVVALVPPSKAARDAGPSGVQLGQAFGFVLGESRADVVEALARDVPALAADKVAPVVDASDVAAYPPQGGRLGPLTLLPLASCDVPSTRAGDPRFPVAQWASSKTRAWLVSGSPQCARDVVGELADARARGVVALTLEAATLAVHAPGVRVVSASAGVVPGGVGARQTTGPMADAGDEELRRFTATLGPVSWWTALGRDAATLARVAARELPTGAVLEPAAVVQRRTQARDALARARAPLWSTEAIGWTDEHVMRRSVCIRDAPTSPVGR
jgi:hypothetical protein